MTEDIFAGLDEDPTWTVEHFEPIISRSYDRHDTRMMGPRETRDYRWINGQWRRARGEATDEWSDAFWTGVLADRVEEWRRARQHFGKELVEENCTQIDELYRTREIQAPLSLLASRSAIDIGKRGDEGMGGVLSMMEKRIGYVDGFITLSQMSRRSIIAHSHSDNKAIHVSDLASDTIVADKSSGSSLAIDRQGPPVTVGGEHATRMIFRVYLESRFLAILLIFRMMIIAEALDNDRTGIVPFDPQHQEEAANGSPILWIWMPQLVQLFAGAFTGIFLILSGHLTGAARTLLGPLMGITGIMWFIMRNDAAIKPVVSWIRLAVHQLYLLLTLAFAGICLCIIGLVQKSSIPGGLVTAIPP
ncbi:hypothetical protein K491DRAFT_723494 [Lophiostoma macrostomum CBS 122681]|uniref:Uncharacterized protein n=1 Tax=Lophiostoma macrostomum CBS 122681 TaxID=1314788 RepID=A0A6A6SHY1_9PLEO|nr:hypothetical protein K491DRAFT_723494 [Lophiostoma macrostomum CBS 122681]